MPSNQNISFKSNVCSSKLIDLNLPIKATRAVDEARELLRGNNKDDIINLSKNKKPNCLNLEVSDGNGTHMSILKFKAGQTVEEMKKYIIDSYEIACELIMKNSD